MNSIAFHPAKRLSVFSSLMPFLAGAASGRQVICLRAIFLVALLCAFLCAAAPQTPGKSKAVPTTATKTNAPVVTPAEIEALPLPAATPTPTGVTPFLDCVSFDAPSNTLTAIFGYVSANSDAVVVALGPDNFFSPDPQNRGQANLFFPGVNHNAFEVAFSLADSSSITWTLLGQSVTASNDPQLYCSPSGYITTFTYQGKLNNGGSPANGTYELEFKVFDALTGGNQQGGTLDFTNANSNAVSVTGGVFTVQLDFGSAAAPNRFLEMGVRKPGDSAFTTLSPRQPLTAVPYAFRSQSARSVDSVGWESSDNVALATTQTLDATSSNVPGMIVKRDGSGNFSLPANSGSYIQNTTSQQSNSNFNISGNGTIGGALSANTVSAASNTDIVFNAYSTSATGTWLRLWNNSTGGHNWNLISTGSANGEGAGKLLFNDQTASNTRMQLDNGGATIFGSLNMNGNKITSVGTPTNGSDAANKSYVDAAVPTTANYVFAYDTTTQTPVVADTFQDITVNTNAQLNGWTHTAGTATFTCPQTGLYLIEYAVEAEVSNIGDIFSFRAELNGAEVAGSQSAIQPSGSAKATPGSKSFIANVTAGNTLALQLAATRTTDTLVQGTGQGTTRPSVSITIIKIQ